MPSPPPIHPSHPLIAISPHLSLHPIHSPPAAPQSPPYHHHALLIAIPETPSHIGTLLNLIKKEPLLKMPHELRHLKRLQRVGKEVWLLMAVIVVRGHPANTGSPITGQEAQHAILPQSHTDGLLHRVVHLPTTTTSDGILHVAQHHHNTTQEGNQNHGDLVSPFTTQGERQSVTHRVESPALIVPQPLTDLFAKHSISIAKYLEYPHRMPDSSIELPFYRKSYQWHEMQTSYLKAREKIDADQLTRDKDKKVVQKWLSYVRETMTEANKPPAATNDHKITTYNNRSARAFCIVVNSKTGEKISEAYDAMPHFTEGLYYTSTEIEILNCCNKSSHVHQHHTTSSPHQSSGHPHPLDHSCMLCISDIATMQLSKSHLTEDEYLCNGYDFYCSHEPCVMCAMALVHARVNRVFFFKAHPKGGLIPYQIHENKSLNHHYKCYQVVEKAEMT
mmetsp:Transcript_6443/g.24157  ORF Transcript_6443/g.24157 Transcript_6443/m.24157 type:complete len:448 (-) Transcript_6443:2441-3784(-)